MPLSKGSKVDKALKAFFAKHPSENFYAMAVDAGYLYLDSEEGLAKRHESYGERWQKKAAAVTAEEVKAIDEDDRDDHFPSFAFEVGRGATFEKALETENVARAARRKDGNPYDKDDSDQMKVLRWSTGEFTYGQLVTLDLDAAYLSHYAKDVPAQAASAYAKKAAAIVAALEANKNDLLAGVKLAPSFRIYAAGHEC